MQGLGLREVFSTITAVIAKESLAVYGQDLVSLGVFGSVGRGRPRYDSDIDVIMVMDNLPRGRYERLKVFEALEIRMVPLLEEACLLGVETVINPVLKSPSEVLMGSPIFIDMVEDLVLLVDRERFLETYMTSLRQRLKELGARRIWRGNSWHWLLKPDYKPGEVFRL